MTPGGRYRSQTGCIASRNSCRDHGTRKRPLSGQEIDGAGADPRRAFSGAALHEAVTDVAASQPDVVMWQPYGVSTPSPLMLGMLVAAHAACSFEGEKPSARTSFALLRRGNSE
jgi:hypothetical protein